MSWLVPWEFKAAGALAAVGAVALGTFHATSRHYELRLAAERTAAAEATAKALAAREAETERRLAAQEEVVRVAHLASTRARADADAATAASASLRVRFDAYLASLHPAPAHPGPASGGAAAADSGAVLADLFGRLEAAGRQLAAIADERGGRGAACEQAYNTLRSH